MEHKPQGPVTVRFCAVRMTVFVFITRDKTYAVSPTSAEESQLVGMPFRRRSSAVDLPRLRMLSPKALHSHPTPIVNSLSPPIRLPALHFVLSKSSRAKIPTIFD